MAPSASAGLVILLAVLAANLPFVSQKFLGLFSLQQPKILALRLAELVLLYLLVGGVGLLLENKAGQIAPQGWEFYAITATLFLTLAFPGFVYRYLFKRHA